MSTQPLTYEGVLEMFRESKLMFQETDRKFQDMKYVISRWSQSVCFGRDEPENHGEIDLLLENGDLPFSLKSKPH